MKQLKFILPAALLFFSHTLFAQVEKSVIPPPPPGQPAPLPLPPPPPPPPLKTIKKHNQEHLKKFKEAEHARKPARPVPPPPPPVPEEE